jgi:DNA-binding transcriptional ArsR family regulator
MREFGHGREIVQSPCSGAPAHFKVYLTTQISYAVDLAEIPAIQSGDRIAMAPRPISIDQRLAKAMSSPLRARALTLIAEGIASPKAISVELDLDVRGVAYHVRVLRKLGCIELVETQQRRGAIEHIYRVVDGVLEKD